MLAQFLQRFRFHGVPGAPAGAAVPLANRSDLLERELSPVFAALDDAQARAAALVDAARRDAARICREGVEAAAATLASARQREPGARNEAVAAVIGEAEAEGHVLVTEATREAEETKLRAEARLGALVREVVESVLDLASRGSSPERQR